MTEQTEGVVITYDSDAFAADAKAYATLIHDAICAGDDWAAIEKPRHIEVARLSNGELVSREIPWWQAITAEQWGFRTQRTQAA